MIRDEGGSWIEDEQQIKSIVNSFYRNLFSEQVQRHDHVHTRYGFRKIERDIAETMIMPISTDEIKGAMFDMGTWKEPGPDGYQAGFYQDNWDRIGDSVCEFVHHMWQHQSDIGGINSTDICLIPKVDKPEFVTQFRPISLYFFQPERGIRQGDPMSLYLFVLCMDKLTHLIEEAVHNEDWIPLPAGRAGPEVSHLMFADDLLLFGKATDKQMRSTMNVLNKFCDISGQVISMEKTSILFSRNVSRLTRDSLISLSGFSETFNLGKYLSIPLLGHAPRPRDFQYIVDKVKAKLSGWKGKHLSFAGRVTLFKAVIQAIPMYTMMTARIPKGCVKDIEKIQRSFIWGDEEQRRKIHLINWNVMTLPRQMGGLAIRDLYTMNRACTMKMGWQLRNGDNSLWCKILRSKYGRGSIDERTLTIKPGDSHIWKGLVQTWDEFQNGERWIIGDGTQVSLWNDVWLAKQTRLVDIINNIPNNALAWKVQQLVGENGEWNMTLIESLLPSHLISNFSSVLPPHVENGEDTRTWGCNKAVTFTIASAYKLLRGFNENGATTVWKLICSLEVPERVGCFAWQVAHETVLHVLRDCRVASFVWRYLIPATLWSVFFGGDMAQWVQFNMVQARHDGRKSWPKTWATACYMLWRWRNREVHDAEYSRPTNTPVIIRRAVADYDMGLRSQNPEHYREMQRRMVQWQRPAEGWICINTDGAAKERGKIAGSGRVMRDHNGIWLCSFSRFIGEATAFDAELWGIFDGLTIARRQGYQHVELQIHSHNVVSCLTNNMERNGLCILVRRIRSIMQENWRVVIKHVYREANKIADGLASLACVTKVSLSLYEQPPTEVAQVYHDDLIGVSTPRLVVL
ncbi:ribonuclease H [Trifolium pratense]|uniref:Ribonuclease H n=1 Tax=Trifolium pratense TaxID=57577 RepID=A0A2K3PQV6_TRIPR|nr:ribonuclease H [Trifolium pratense]